MTKILRFPTPEAPHPSLEKVCDEIESAIQGVQDELSDCDVRPEKITEDMFELHARLRFHQGACISVHFVAELIADGNQVRIKKVKYHASGIDQNLFRYCYPHMTHNEFHHKHTYDTAANAEIKPASRIESFPNLKSVLNELKSDYTITVSESMTPRFIKRK